MMPWPSCKPAASKPRVGKRGPEPAAAADPASHQAGDLNPTQPTSTADLLTMP